MREREAATYIGVVDFGHRAGAGFEFNALHLSEYSQMSGPHLFHIAGDSRSCSTLVIAPHVAPHVARHIARHIAHRVRSMIARHVAH